MFEKLGIGIRSHRDTLTSRKKDTSEVPVRDSSVMAKSKSSNKNIVLKDIQTLRKF